MELLLNTEVLLSLLRGLFTSSQDLARDEMGAEIVGAGRLCGRDDGGVGGIDCSCCGRCCGATVIFVDSGAQPEVYLLVWWGVVIVMELEFSLDGITMADSGDFLCFPKHQCSLLRSPRYFSAMAREGESNALMDEFLTMVDVGMSGLGFVGYLDVLIIFSAMAPSKTFLHASHNLYNQYTPTPLLLLLLRARLGGFDHLALLKRHPSLNLTG